MNADDDDEPDRIGQLDFTPIFGYNTTISPDDCDVSRDVWVCVSRLRTFPKHRVEEQTIADRLNKKSGARHFELILHHAKAREKNQIHGAHTCS